MQGREELGRHRERWVMMRYEQYSEVPGRTMSGGPGQPKTQLGNVCYHRLHLECCHVGKIRTEIVTGFILSEQAEHSYPD